uniref:Ig-like domain-containing protein n=1 Tax=Paramormyrops kingsleyae TaxID=1676925 RepID=A0A3B3Q9Q6_9TELE
AQEPGWYKPPVEFTKPLEDQTVEEEATAILECEVSREKAEVRWFREGQEIHKTKKYDIVTDGRKRKLIIQGCTLDDSKTYTCDAKDFKTSAFLNVEREYYSHVNTNKRTNADLLQMILTKYVCRGSSTYGSEIRKGKKYEIIAKGVQHILIVNKAVFDDEAEYECDAKTSKTSGMLTVIGEFKLIIHLYFQCFINGVIKFCHMNKKFYETKYSELAADFISRPQSQEVVEGQKAEFVCSVSKDTYEVKWLKGDKELEAGEKYDIVCDGKRRALIIKDCLLQDEGPYVALIGTTRATAELFVIEEDLRIIEPLEDCETQEKRTVTFSCKVNKPNVTVQWMKAGEEITFNKHISYRVDKDKHMLTIKECSLADEAEYSVIAGSDKSTAELIISEAPTDFLTKLVDQTVTEFEDAEFSCMLTKDKGEVKWYKNGREIKEGPRYFFEKEGEMCKLHIKECRPDDEARLFVEGKLEIITPPKDIFEAPGSDVIFEVELNKDRNLVIDAGKPFTMIVPYDAYPRAEAEWFYNEIYLPEENIDTFTDRTEYKLNEPEKSDQGRYKIIIRNKHGKAEAFINLEVIDVPEAPQNVNVRNVNKFGATLSWEPPLYDGGSEITAYIIELPS